MKTIYMKKNTESTRLTARMLFWSLICCLVFLDAKHASAAYVCRATGDWNDPNTWNSNGVLATAPPAATDTVTIDNGFLVFLTGSGNCYRLSLGSSSIAGTLEFRSGRYYTLTVTENITVNGLGTIRTGSTTTGNYKLTVGGNILNNGTINLYQNDNNNVDLEFNTGVNSLVYGGTNWVLGNVIMNKVSRTNRLDAQVTTASFENAIRVFYGTCGTFVHNNTGTYSINPDSNFTIGANAIFLVPQGTMNFSANADILNLNGELQVTGGTVNVGKSTGLEGIRTEKLSTTTVVPKITLSSGTLNVTGGITYKTGTTTAAFINMTGGTMNINTGSTGSSRELLFLCNVTGSQFSMTNGNIVLYKPNTTPGTTVTDVNLLGLNVANLVSGGTIQFGNGSVLTKGFSYVPLTGTKKYPNFLLFSAVQSGGITLAPAQGSSTAEGTSLLSLTINTGTTFSMIPYLASTSSATLSIYSTSGAGYSLQLNGTFITSVSTVSFKGSAKQWMGSTNTGSTPTLYNVSINNPNHVEMRSTVNLSNYLSLTSGNLITYYNYNFAPSSTTSHRLLVLLDNCTTNAGSNSSYVDGPLVNTVSSTSAVKYFPIGKASALRPVAMNMNHSTTGSVTYMAEVINTPPGTPPALDTVRTSGISNVRYVQLWRAGANNFVNGNLRIYYNADDGVVQASNTLIAQNNYNYNNAAALIPSGSPNWITYGNSPTNTNFGTAVSMSYVERSLDQSVAFNSPTGLSNYQPSYALAFPPSSTNPLPISLTTFAAQLDRNKVLVNWETQVEFNNEFFSVERSADNITYYPIGNVSGAGTTTIAHSYSFVDNRPLNGISYYRLRQVDFDGQYQLYGTAIINFRRGAVRFYPNPCSSPVIHVSILNDEIDAYTLTVRDLLGREISAKTRPGQDGHIEVVFDESESRHGSIYIMSANNGEEQIQEKIIIQ
jgi:hypothetical protein